ncbi:hypothetical protein F8M41_019667 [Gigaspora margarita]|uniref:Protein kinase domain-containing protein n=1 Tax=Gigaspora margarita TaxID=4874 RepID=A0A8H4AJI7_GIGMA|nr:hypothetical protein F8M41_019667 [Gigaspora margarita]
MKWNDQLYLAKQIANAIKHLYHNNIMHGNLWYYTFESESPFGYDCLIGIIHGKRETDAIGTPREYSLFMKIVRFMIHDANKCPSIHGIGTDVDYHKAFWIYKLSSEIDIKNIFKNNLDNLS